MNVNHIIQQHGLWLAESGGTRADLSWANLRRANLSRADLRWANLSWANLSGANLRWADLRRADLSWANLSWADLRRADLSEANLRWANLSWANLSGAELREANLSEADLSEANLSGADLSGTCLDPSASIPDPGDAAIIAAGFEIKDGWVYGWRTSTSRHVSRQTYMLGTYTAPVFSVADTECHPGIYIASRAWLDRHYPGIPVVRCRTRRELIHHAERKWRTKELEVLPNE